MHFASLERKFILDAASGRAPRPFEEKKLGVRLAPFLGLTVATLAVVPFAYGGPSPEIVASFAILAAIITAAFLLPWGHLPASLQAIPILALYAIAALVRDATGGGDSVFNALILLPVVWFALYGTINQVLLSVVGCFVSIGLPVLIVGPPEYPTSELGRAALDSLMTGALGAICLGLMRRIREREELARSILDSAHEAFISVDEEGRITEWSRQAERDFGWPRAEVIGRSLAETIIPEDDRRHYEPGLQRLLGGDSRLLGRRLEITATRRNGICFPVEMTFHGVTTSEGHRFNAFVQDISERRRSEEALHQANQRFRSAFDDAAIGMAIVSTEGLFLRVNRAMVDLIGYSEDELVGIGFSDITHPEDLEEGIQALEEMVAGDRDRYQAEKRYLHADGHEIWADISATVVRDGDRRPLYLLSQIQDIGARKETEARLTHRASHDELTGLPNRGMLEERMILAQNRQWRERRPIAVFYLDLDGFKRVNDTHGHDAGDYLLTAIAKRLTSLVRPTDVVSRLGGDEFVILCEAMDENGATRLAKRIMEVVAKPIDVEGVGLAVTPSIGIALSRDPATRPSELIADADMAMYFAKEDASSGYAFFEDDLQRTRGDLALEGDLER